MQEVVKEIVGSQWDEFVVNSDKHVVLEVTPNPPGMQ